MAARVIEFIAILVATSLAVVKVEAMSTALCFEPVSASMSSPPLQLKEMVYGGTWCSSNNDEECLSTPVTFLQVDIQVNSSAAESNLIAKSARASTRYSSRGRGSSFAALALGVDSEGTSQNEASTTSGGLGLLVIGIVVFAIVLAIWLTLPDEVEDTKARQMSVMGHRIDPDRLASQAMVIGAHAVGSAQAVRLGRQDLRAGEVHLRSPMPPAQTPAFMAEDRGRIDASSLADRSRGVGETTGVPPICQQLILPKTEARFQIKLSELMGLTPDSKLEIKGTSGRTLLNAKLVVDGATRMLQISSVGCDDDPRTTVKATSGGEALVLWGKLESSERLFEDAYGTIEQIPNSTGSVLKHKGVPVMNIEMGDPRDLEMKAVSLLTRRELANAGRLDAKKAAQDTREPTRSEDYWKLAVKAGADAVLIASCMLGIVLLKGVNPNDRLSATPMIVRSPALSLTPGATAQPTMQPQARPSDGLVPTRPGSLPGGVQRSPPTAYYRP